MAKRKKRTRGGLTPDYRWKKKFAGMGVAKLRRLKQLEEENRNLKRPVTALCSSRGLSGSSGRTGGEARVMGHLFVCSASQKSRLEPLSDFTEGVEP